MTDKPGLTGASPLSQGDVVANRYRVLEEIGRGGYAIVYRALDTKTGDVVALKTIRPIAPRPEEVRERFRREAELVSRLKHPNTVRVFDYGFETDFYLAMELLEGHPLSDLLDGENGISLERAVFIVTGVLESLTEAHRLGIVHRDLKPENVFLVQRMQGDTRLEHVKVLDFGIAKAVLDDSNMPALTLKGRAMGTPAYMSPEQAKGARLTVHSDLYSVAVLLYEMICGVPPFNGDSAMTIMLKHVNEAPPQLTPARLRGTALDAAIQKALSKNPFDRFGSAEEFLTAISHATARVDQPAATAPQVNPSSPAAATASVASQGASSEPPPQASLKKENLFASWFKRR
jgi:serine/threonine protein kinase